MMIEPEDMDWTAATDVVVALAAQDGVAEAQAEMQRRAATAPPKQQRPAVSDATRPRPINY